MAQKLCSGRLVALRELGRERRHQERNSWAFDWLPVATAPPGIGGTEAGPESIVTGLYFAGGTGKHLRLAASVHPACRQSQVHWLPAESHHTTTLLPWIWSLAKLRQSQAFSSSLKRELLQSAFRRMASTASLDTHGTSITPRSCRSTQVSCAACLH